MFAVLLFIAEVWRKSAGILGLAAYGGVFIIPAVLWGCRWTG